MAYVVVSGGITRLAVSFGEACLAWRAAPRPVVEGTPKRHPAWEAVAERLAQVLREAGASPEEIAGGQRLWWDAVRCLQPCVQSIEPWVGGLVYLLGKLVYMSM